MEPVEAVDTLLRSFRENGADRAIDLLLDCRFAEFFGLKEAEASYAGELAERMRELAREDLPVSKYGR